MRRYVPELKDYDKKYIYEPSKAPVGVQRKAGCLVRGDGAWPGKETGNKDASKGEEGKEGKCTEDADSEDDDDDDDGDDGLRSYPRPMFDFAERRDFCIKAMKDAYHIGLHGDDPRVLDGSWRKLFADTTQDPIDGGGGGEEKAKEKGEGGPGKGKREASQNTLDGVVKRTRKK